jgi:uncharacterized protein
MRRGSYSRHQNVDYSDNNCAPARENNAQIVSMKKSFVLLLIVGLAVWQLSRRPNNLLLDMAGAHDGDAVVMLKLAVFMGADVDATNKDGLTAVQLAVRAGNAGNLKYLLDHHAGITGATPGTQSELSEAILSDTDTFSDAKRARANIVQVLLQHGANANERDAHRIPVLIYAVMRGELDIVEALVDHGAEVNAVLPTGETPLHAAVEGSGNLQIADFLVAHGANTKARNNDGKTPLDLVIDSSEINDPLVRAALIKALQQ